MHKTQTNRLSKLKKEIEKLSKQSFNAKIDYDTRRALAWPRLRYLQTSISEMEVKMKSLQKGIDEARRELAQEHQAINKASMEESVLLHDSFVLFCTIYFKVMRGEVVVLYVHKELDSATLVVSVWHPQRKDAGRGRIEDVLREKIVGAIDSRGLSEFVLRGQLLSGEFTLTKSESGGVTVGSNRVSRRIVGRHGVVDPTDVDLGKFEASISCDNLVAPRESNDSTHVGSVLCFNYKF